LAVNGIDGAFNSRHNAAWLPEMRMKYPNVAKTTSLETSSTDEDMMTPLEQMANSFHLKSAELIVGEFARGENPWGVLHMRIKGDVLEPSLPKRLTMLALASLRASGTFR